MRFSCQSKRIVPSHLLRTAKATVLTLLPRAPPPAQQLLEGRRETGKILDAHRGAPAQDANKSHPALDRDAGGGDIFSPSPLCLTYLPGVTAGAVRVFSSWA